MSLNISLPCVVVWSKLQSPCATLSLMALKKSMQARGQAKVRDAVARSQPPKRRRLHQRAPAAHQPTAFIALKAKEKPGRSM
jgi:hypothetical protein